MNPETKKRKKKLFFALKLVISLSLIVFIFSKLDINKVFITIIGGNILLLAIAFGIHAFQLFVRTYKYNSILKVQGFTLPKKLLFRLFLVRSFFDMFLPATIGGDIALMVEVARAIKKKFRSVLVVLIDRISGLYIQFLISLISLLIGWRMLPSNMRTTVLVIDILALGMFFLFFNKQFNSMVLGLTQKLKRFDEKMLFNRMVGTFYIYKTRPKESFTIFFLSLIIQVLIVLYFPILGLAYSIYIPLLYYFIFIPIIVILAMVPISINGLGVKEGLFILLFSTVGADPSRIVAIPLTQFFFSSIYGIIGGLIYITRR